MNLRTKPLDMILAAAEKKGLKRQLGWFELTMLGIGAVIGTGIFVLTAVGLARPDQLPIMVGAIVLAILVMMWVSGSISTFIDRHPTIKILALAFLILVGVVLIADAFHFSVPKGYLYFAMAFSVGVEMVNIRLRRLMDERRDKRDESEGG